MTDSAFRFRRIVDATATLAERLRHTLAASHCESVNALLDELPPVASADAGSSEVPLSLAFVGQYNAGKSTLIRALTGREDIPMDADVCTDVVTAYDWRGIRLLDTPGVHAGHPDHDEQTLRCIAQADLLLFVITPELFDDTVGEFFRRLAFEDGKAPELMLVVNKMGMTPATPEVLRGDIERVTAPLSLQDLRTVFVDALACIEAEIETDPADRAALLEIANLTALEQAIDLFVTDQGLWARLTTPLYVLRSIAHRGAALSGAGDPDTRARIAKLAHALRELGYSEARLRGKLDALVAEASADIAQIGDELARTLSAGTSAARSEELGPQAQRRVQERAERLEQDALRVFEDEWQDLAARLDQIAAPDGSATLVHALPSSPASTVRVGAGASDAPVTPVAERYVKAVEAVGQSLARLAAGPERAEKAGRLVASSGSQAHEMVKKFGRILGHKFRPWEAVKWAHWIGKVGDVLAKAGPILTILLGLIEDWRRKQAERELAEMRSEIRNCFRQIAAELTSRFRQWGNGTLFAAYRVHREYVEEELQRLVESEGHAAEERRAFEAIIADAGQLIKDASAQMPAPME